MFKSLNSPENLFRYSMWLVSLLFAFFLVGLGGKLIADLPSIDTAITLDQFTDQARFQAALSENLSAQAELRQLSPLVVEASGQLDARKNAYTTAQGANRNWLATRSVTATNPNAAAQDPDLLRQTQQLSILNEAMRAAQIDVETLEAKVRAVSRTQARTLDVMAAERDQARPAYMSAVRVQGLKAFGYRLALTLPLLGAAGWLIARKRKSSYWPLARGFIIFAAFAFFVELVPYLPDVGGYVRYVVGIASSLVGGHYAINWMRAYLARRTADSARNEKDRRLSLDKVLAIRKIAKGLCPGCDRSIAAERDGVKVNNCVFCGLRLFDVCNSVGLSAGVTGAVCGVRKNAFFHFCPSCGEAPKKNFPPA